MRFKKEVIKSLPTQNENCVSVDYETCALDTIKRNAIEQHNCSLPFFSNEKKLPQCSNEMTLVKIKEIKMALSNKEGKYRNCKDDKPCNIVNFQLTNAESAIQYEDDTNISSVKLLFRDYIVEEITDTYNHNFISMFSDVGGALGILVGLSCMTVVEFLINLDWNSLKKW